MIAFKQPFYKKRALRTIILAVFATATFVASAILIFDVDAALMLEFFLASLLGLGILIGAALIFTACTIVIRRWLNR